MTNSISTADALIAALREPGREHLVDLVRNPLRLTLLCMTWDGLSLPDTQAELYDRYLRKMYGWNRNLQVLRDHARCCGMTITQLKQELNRELGELAKAALNLSQERFRLSQVLVEEYLGEELDESSLACLALRLGWLNRVGRDGRGDFIFAFYHATFQEYFAALAVEDWGYFLPKDHVDRPVVGKEYRIFEKQWKQVILLWLGREDVGDEEKEGFIRALVEFEDGFTEVKHHNGRGFYEFQAYFLAAAAINQFKACSLATEIVRQVVKWGFGEFDIQKQKWTTFLDLIKAGARKAMPETIRPLAISALIDILDHCHNDNIRWQAAWGLGKIGQGNSQAITTLVKMTATLVKMIETTEDEYTLRMVEHTLRNVAESFPANQEAITALFTISQKHKNPSPITFMILGKIGQGNPSVINGFVKLIENHENEYARSEAAYWLKRISQGNSIVIDFLVKLIENPENVSICKLASDSLQKIAQGDNSVIDTLSKLMETTRDENTRWWVAWSVKKIRRKNESEINALTEILETIQNKNTRRQDTLSIEENQQKNDLNTLIKLIENSKDEKTREEAVKNLGKIGQGNPEAISALVKVIETTQDEVTREQVAKSLGEIGSGNPMAITALVKLIENSKDEQTREQAVENLGKIGQGSPEAVAALVNLIATTDNEDTLSQAAGSLGKILTTPQQYAGVVTALKHNLSDEVYQNNFDRFEASYKVIWKCAKNLPYPDFYQAWHNPPTTPHPEIENNTPTGPTPFTQHQNLNLLPQILNQTNPTNHQIICIDTNRFSDPSNPALQIYTTLKKAGCPHINDKPRTIPELQAYCGDELSNHQIALILHQQPTNPPPQNLDLGVLNQLARFSHPPIALILPQPLPHCPLPQFLDNDPNLIPTIIQWLQNLEREQL